jgi:hypothetical protein
VTYSQTRVASARRKGPKEADDSESQSDEPFQPSASALARMNRAVVATPSHTAHVPLGGVSSLLHTRSVAFSAAPVAGAFVDASGALAGGVGGVGPSNNAAATPAPVAVADTKMCVVCNMRKANSQCSNSACRSDCFAIMSRTGISCTEHTKARATLERDRQSHDAPEQLLSAAVANALNGVTSAVARAGGPRLDPLAPYTSAVGDALTGGQPVLDTAALSAASCTSIISPASGQRIAVHGGNFWSHLYASDRANLGAYLQLAVDRARDWNVAPNNALLLPSLDAVDSDTRPVDQVRARASERLADNEALLGSLFGLATPEAAGAHVDAASQWKRIEAQVEALDGTSLEAAVVEAEAAAQVYADAIQRINECSSVADVTRCREKMKREWQAAFDDGGLKRRRSSSSSSTAQHSETTLNL